MRTGVRGLVLAITAALALSAVPFATAAAATATTTTLGFVPATIHFTDVVAFSADVSPTPDGGAVYFEVSGNEVGWLTFAVAAVDTSDGTASVNYPISTIAFTEGAMFVRARFDGTAGVLGSTSQSAPTTIERKATSVDQLQLLAAWPELLPGTTQLTLHAFVPGTNEGSVAFDRQTESGWEEIGTNNIAANPPTGEIGLNFSGPLGEGSRTFRARYLGTSMFLPSEARITQVVSRGNATATIDAPSTVETGLSFNVTFGLGYAPNDVQPTGEMTLKDKASGTTLGTGLPGTSIQLGPLTPGTRTYVASYAGDANFLPDDVETTVVIGPDQVHVTGVGVSATSIYPYIDGYRDTVAIRGTREEQASVAIRIYSPTNSLVRGATIASGTGAWSFTWNGKSSSGAALAAGKYKITQTVKDTANTTKVFTHYVTLSTKRLSYKTVYITKNGSAVTVKGDPGSGTITLSSSGLATLKAGSYPSGWVGVGYQFTLPTATVYKSIAFQAYVKGPRSAPSNGMGMQNFQTCPYSSTAAWDEACFSLNAVPAATSYAWVTSAGSPTKSRYGRTARGIISVNFGTVYVSKVRIKLVIGALV